MQELRDQKGVLAKSAQEVLDLAAKEGRFDLRSDEEEKFDRIHAEIEKITKHIDRIEKQEALTVTEGRKVEPGTTSVRPEVTVTRPNMMDGLRSWLLGGSDVERTPAMHSAANACGFNLDSRQIHLKFPRTPLTSLRQDDVREWEQRAALGTTSGAVGQYTVPDEAMKALEIALLTYGGMRQVATVIRTDSGAALPIPTTNDTGNSGVILAENTQAAELEMTFGQLVLDAFKYSSKYILVSVEMLQDSSINVAQFVGEALGIRIGRITNSHFTSGDGSSKPRGLTAAATSYGSTGSATAITYDELLDLEHSVDPAYRRNGRWMFKDSTLKLFKKLRVPQYSGDSLGQPLWQPGMAVGQPDTILGYPYIINQEMPAATTGLRAIAFGDFSKYIIRDVRDVTLLRLDERFADYHQVAFLAFSRHDGDLLDAGTNPVKVLTQA
jgi:HK97 family phage major capsid protein